jgi:hypothetical protein
MYSEYADPFESVFKARKSLIKNIDMVKAALAGKGIVYEHNLLIKLLNDEASSFLASQVMQPVNSFIDNCNFEFFNILANEGAFSADFVRERLFFIFKNTFFFHEAEKYLKSSCNIFRYDVADKYLPEIASAQGSIWSGINKDADSSLTEQDWISFIKTIFLIRPMVYVKMLSSGSKSISIESSNDFIKWCGRDFSPLPGAIIGEAYRSLLCADGSSSGFLSRLVYIFDMMYRIHPWPGQYTGAEESHDKSWLSMAMVNSDYYGFDKGIIEELYLIAGDNNW